LNIPPLQLNFTFFFFLLRRASPFTGFFVFFLFASQRSLFPSHSSFHFLILSFLFFSNFFAHISVFGDKPLPEPVPIFRDLSSFSGPLGGCSFQNVFFFGWFFECFFDFLVCDLLRSVLGSFERHVQLVFFHCRGGPFGVFLKSFFRWLFFFEFWSRCFLTLL